jgi:hypothetical protein
LIASTEIQTGNAPLTALCPCPDFDTAQESVFPFSVLLLQQIAAKSDFDQTYQWIDILNLFTGDSKIYIESKDKDFSNDFSWINPKISWNILAFKKGINSYNEYFNIYHPINFNIQRNPPQFLFKNFLFNIKEGNLSFAGSTPGFCVINEIEEKGVRISNDAVTFLKAETAFLMPLKDAINRIRNFISGKEFSDIIGIDIFKDPETEPRTMLRVIIHPSEKMDWDQQMKFWDEISDDISSILPKGKVRSSIIISIEPLH